MTPRRREPDGSLIARLADEDWKLYHFDALGSTVALTNAAGTVTDKYDYDPWGNLESRTGSTEQPYQYVGQLGYYTHYQDDNMQDLLHLGVRFYEPGVGRFGQRDAIPIESSADYAFVANAPTRLVDPNGREYGNWDEWWNDVKDAGCLCSARIFWAARHSLDEARRRYPSDSLHNGRGDAWRHCYWACLSAQACGKEKAEKVLDNHELYGGNQSEDEMNMDFGNNDEGFKCAGGKTSCADCCTRKLKNGDLVWIGGP